MLIVYFRNKETGEIASYTKFPREVPRETIEANAAKYNNSLSSFEAVVYEIEDGSLEHYLLGLCERKSAYEREAISDALAALQTARDAIESLK